ncbi:MAG: hypothetical protein NC089_10900 [Bacteroides sp.]|nr:hypothetical protein [Bacteroides sp.]MCM1550395.1 hypothetical protein [Clostridium sp.]
MRKKHLVLWVIGMLILGCLGGCGNPNEDAIMQDTDDKESVQEALGEPLTETEENAEKEINEASGEQTDAPEYVSSMEEVEALGLPEDMLAFWLVLTGRKTFVSVEEDYQEFYWDEFCWNFGKPSYPYSVSRFMLVDMNGDGAEEVVMECMPESTQVLYYEDGVVYNYQFVFRGMKRIHTNGVYEGSNGAASTYFYRLTELNSQGYKEEKIAFCDDEDYGIGDKAVSQQEFSNYVLQTIESVELAEDMEFTEAMLDKHLLGDLSEDALFIVKHIPVEEAKAVTVNEPGRGNHKMMFWLVANSQWKFISTDDRNYREQMFYLKDFQRFLGEGKPNYQVEQFALTDLDGDGRDEMILKCDPDAIQVLYMADEMYQTEYGTGYGREVYSYQWRANDMRGIRTNGVYCRYGGSSRIAYHRVTEFNADGYRDEVIARSFHGRYEVEGQEATEQEFYDYIEGLNSEEKAEFYDFTEENLNKYLLGDIYVSVQQVFNSITDDMLNALEEYPSFDSYWNDSLVLLDKFNENVRLYGINATKQTAMLLSIEGERVLIEEGPYPSFRNFYQELPNLNVLDVDGDGEDEVMISLRTVTGSPISRYAMLVCDHKDTWNIYMYYDYLRDVQNLIQYRYDDETNSIAFLDNEDNVLWEGKLPEWTMEYPYAGTVNFGDKVRFDAETFQMDIVPGIELENSLPYEPVKITFHLGFTDGRFEIVSYDVNSYRVIEEGVNQ